MDKSEEFVKQLMAIRDYWLNESRAKTAKEKMDGFLFSVLVMFDGGAGVNDCHPLEIKDLTDGKVIDSIGCLHEVFSGMRD